MVNVGNVCTFLAFLTNVLFPEPSVDDPPRQRVGGSGRLHRTDIRHHRPARQNQEFHVSIQQLSRTT